MQFYTSKSFNLKKHSDVIIFDETNSNLVKIIIPKTYSHSVYKTRPIEIIITIQILLRFFVNLKDLKIFTKYSKKVFLTNVLWQILCIYIKSYIQVAKPRAVITSIDNCNKFAWLSKNIPEIPFIAIQNGFRLNYAVDKESLYNCQHLFCFGNFEVEKFPVRDWTVNNFYPVGSLGASLNFKTDYINKECEFDILVISCWRGNIGFSQDVQDSMRAMRLFDQNFAAYLNEKDLKAAVILRSERNDEDWFIPEIGMTEGEYFESMYGDNLIILDTDFKTRNVYSTMQKAHLIIASFPTTCLFEALGIEKKVLFCDFTDNDMYFSDIKEDILYKHDNQNKTLFNKKLNSLLLISQKDYQIDFQDIMDYYASSSNSVPTSKLISSKVDDILKLELH
tara:strand:+ start:2868 stop:4046 length:1179 start_codon:yes stop_codon:yes gene_type:complete